MLDFEKELKKFQPMKDVDQLEEVIVQEGPSDLTDLMRDMLNEIRENEETAFQSGAIEK